MIELSICTCLYMGKVRWHMSDLYVDMSLIQLLENKY